jgi:hypothetical protein
MGCDIWWEGQQQNKNIQTQCCYYLQKLARRLKFEYDIINNLLRGNIIYWTSGHKPEAIFLKELDVFGISVYPYGKRVFKDFYREPLEGQISFVFNNSDEGRIITIGEISKDDENLTSFREFIDHHIPVFGSKTYGYWRAMDERWFIILLLRLIRKWYIPSLQIEDDKLASEAVDRALEQGKISMPLDIRQLWPFTLQMVNRYQGIFDYIEETKQKFERALEK